MDVIADKKMKANIGINYISHSFNQAIYHKNSMCQFGLKVQNTSLITCTCSESIWFTSLQVNTDKSKTKHLFVEENEKGNRNSFTLLKKRAYSENSDPCL